MKELRVEIVSVHEAQKPLCANAAVLLRALSADPAFSVTGTRLRYLDSLSCDYTAVDWFKVDDQLGVLHSFTFRAQDEVVQADCDDFSAMLRAFRTNLRTLEAKQIETLWDDVSFRYCQFSYPIILHTENQMRRLITQFMLKNLGAKWIELSAPDEITQEIKKTKRSKDGADPLHNVDFATLVDYLTRPYASETQDSMHKFIRSIDPSDSENLRQSVDKLKGMVPQSNWSRYFSSIVECEDSQLRSKWNELYELRCKVAHNTYITSTEFQRVVDLSGELDEITTSAIAKLGQVRVSVKDAAELEDMATRLTENMADADSLQSGAKERLPRGRRVYREVLSDELRRVMEVLRDVAVAFGEPVPDEYGIFEIRRILSRIGLLDSHERQVIDRAVDMLGRKELLYPAESLIEVRSELGALRLAKIRLLERESSADAVHAGMKENRKE